jgi:hypothetical protein
VPEIFRGEIKPHHAGRNQRQENGGRTHVLDALDQRIAVASDAVGQFFDRGIEQLDDQQEEQYADQREAFAGVAGDVEGERR